MGSSSAVVLARAVHDSGVGVAAHKPAVAADRFRPPHAVGQRPRRGVECLLEVAQVRLHMPSLAVECAPAVTRRCQDRRSDRTVAFFRTTAAVRRRLPMWRVQLSRRGSIE